MSKIKLLRISTVSHSMDLLLKGQLRYMSNNGFDVYCAFSPDDKAESIAEREHAKYHPLMLSRKLTPLADLKSLFQAIRLIRRVKPDIVHTHSPKAGIVGMMASKICGVRLKIHTVAGLPLTESRGIKRKILELVEKATYKFSDFVLPNSKLQRDFILSNGWLDNKDKILVLGNGGSNGIDLSYFKEDEIIRNQALSFRNEHGILDDDVVLCFVGRLAYYKGINELIKSFRELEARYNKIKLVLVGPFEDLNPLLPETKDYIKNSKNIFPLGHQADIRPYLSLSDIFVFPSYREGFPQSLMQAGAMGLPSIATNINGCNEIVKDGKTGFLIEPKHVDSLTKALEKLIADPNLRNELGIAAEAFTRTNFEQGDFWKTLSNFYREKLEEISR